MQCEGPDVDRIILPEMPLRARVGVSAEERASEQEIFVDVELGLDLRPAGTSDDFGLTVDYEAVCEAVAAVARSRPFALIEAIAEECARVVLTAFAVEEVRVRVRKPGALRSRGVPYAAVEVLRRRG
ncbi:MAG: dihydroneopterin aldolase [Gemmatimonadetes bacterium]|nr:dihydroneopterin aldolase [Gemmatimonadota bacterium]